MAMDHTESRMHREYDHVMSVLARGLEIKLQFFYLTREILEFWKCLDLIISQYTFVQMFLGVVSAIK